MTSDLPQMDTPDARQRLLKAAGEVFAQKGFEAASVREICALAQVNIASINYYFGGTGGKERLYIESVKQAHLSSTVGEELPTWPPGTPARQKLIDFIRVMVGRMFAPAEPVCMQLVMRELAFPSQATREIVRDNIQPMAFMLRQILTELLPAKTEEQLLMTGFSIIGQILYYRQNRPVSELIFGRDHIDRLTLQGVTDHITRFSLNAIGQGEPGGTE